MVPYGTLKVCKTWSSFWIYRAPNLSGQYCWSLPIAYFIAWNLDDLPSCPNPVSNVFVWLCLWSPQLQWKCCCIIMCFLYDVYAKYWSIRSVTKFRQIFPDIFVPDTKNLHIKLDEICARLVTFHRNCWFSCHSKWACLHQHISQHSLHM
jgi:hypothetical protein